MSGYLVSSRARVRRCSCGVFVIFGLAEGVPVVVDVTPLSRDGELQCVVEARRCYGVVGRATGEVMLRDVEQLRSVSRLPVLPEHRCGDPVRASRYVDWPIVPVANDATPGVPF